MSGYVTIPRAQVEAMRDQLGKAARKLEGGRLGDIVQATADILDDALAGEYEDAGDPAANDTRPDPELLAALRDAVRVQEPVCVLEIVRPGRHEVLETMHDYPIPAGVGVALNMQLRIPSEGDEVRLARVVDVALHGRAAIVKAVVWGTMAAKGPEPERDNF